MLHFEMVKLIGLQKNLSRKKPLRIMKLNFILNLLRDLNFGMLGGTLIKLFVDYDLQA